MNWLAIVAALPTLIQDLIAIAVKVEALFKSSKTTPAAATLAALPQTVTKPPTK